MAKVEKNLILEGLSGMLGRQIVVRRRPDGSYVVSARPHFPEDREPTEQQKKQREIFREAIEYAKTAKAVEEYKKEAETRGISTFNVATADFLHPADIKDIDLSEYNGSAGDKIKILAIDDVMVKEVGVLIIGEDNKLIEKGKAVQEAVNKLNWIYTATTNANTHHIKVIIDAADLPGHITEETVEKEI